MADNSTINGQEFQHASIDLQIAGDFGTLALETFKALDYEDGSEKKPVNQANGKIRGYTIDNQKTNGSISMLLSEWKAFKARFKQAYPGKGIGQIAFNWTVTYGPSLAGLMTDKLNGVMFQKEARKSSDNQEALVIEIPLFIPEIQLHDGNFIEFAK